MLCVELPITTQNHMLQFEIEEAQIFSRFEIVQAFPVYSRLAEVLASQPVKNRDDTAFSALSGLSCRQ